MTSTLDRDIREFQNLLADRAALTHAQTILDFDAETLLPEEGGEGYGRTMGVLAGYIYRQLASDQAVALLDRLVQAKDGLPLHLYREAEELKDEQRRLLAVSQQEYRDFQQARSEGGQAWLAAKSRGDYALFQPHLERLLDYTVRFAHAYDNSRPVYDVLLEDYEKGLTTSMLDDFFARLKKELPPLVKAAATQPRPDTRWLKQEFPISGQEALTRRVLDMLGLPSARCALAQSEHPFTTAASNRDVRLTTHYYENRPLSALFSALHEGGHALYMLNTADELNGLSLAGGAGMAVHESQSRLFENMVGRSREFLDRLFPLFSSIFPGQCQGRTGEDLYRAANLVRPGLLRVEADELTYPLHVIIRYELEQRLLAGELSCEALPAAWNELYAAYLGVEAEDVRYGVLQDMHWSNAGFGYFPTYAVGSAYAAQIMAAARREPDIQDQLQEGQLPALIDWLRNKLYRWGGVKTPAELLADISGGEFDARYYLDYLKKKYGSL